VAEAELWVLQLYKVCGALLKQGVTTSGNPENLLEFEIPSGNTGNLLECNRFSWKFFYNRSMIEGARCAWAMAVHPAVGISHQRNSGYRPSRVNIMAQGLSTPNPSLSPTHLSIRRGCATTTHYTHHQVSLVVSCNTTLVPSLGCTLSQPVGQASALACEGSVCHPK